MRLLLHVPHFIIRKTVNFVTLTPRYVFRVAELEYINYQHRTGNRLLHVNRSTRAVFKKNEIKWYTTPLPGQVNVCNIITVSHPKERPRHVGVQHTRWMSKRINLLSLSRLGHNLSIRKYLACFVVASSTRHVLPRLIRHITIRVIERNDVPNRRQKLKLRPLCFQHKLISYFYSTVFRL